MELQNKFNVPVSIGEAWALLLDVEKVAMCMPGATLDSVNGDKMTGRVKVKLGPIAMTYSGTARFVERNDDAHVLVLDAAGKDVRGAGGAKAKMKLSLREHGPKTTECTVTTDLAVTGKPAQFGRGVMADVSARLIDQFAQRLAEEVERPRPPETAVYVEERHDGGSPTSAKHSKDDDAIILLRPPDLKRLTKAIVPAAIMLGTAAIAAIGLWLLRKNRSGKSNSE